MNADKVRKELRFLRYVVDRFRVESNITCCLCFCIVEDDDGLISTAIHASEVVNLFGECFSSIIFYDDGLVRVSRYFYSIREDIFDRYWRRVSDRLMDEMIKSRGFWLDSRNIEYLRRRFPKSFEFHDEITRVTSEVSERYGYPIRAVIDDEGNSYIMYEGRFPGRDRFSLVDDVIKVLAAFREIHKTLYSLGDEYYMCSGDCKLIGYASLFRFLNLAEEVFKVLEDKSGLIFKNVCIDPTSLLGDTLIGIYYIKSLDEKVYRSLEVYESEKRNYAITITNGRQMNKIDIHNLDKLPDIIKNLKL